MNRLTDNKIVMVTRPTRLAELVIRFNTVSQARFYVEHQGADFSVIISWAQMRHIIAALTERRRRALGQQTRRVQTVDRYCFLPNFVFASRSGQRSMTMGQDGLVANTREVSEWSTRGRRES